MTYIQITNALSEGPVSGNELRNHKLLNSLRKITAAERIAIDPLHDGPANSDRNMMIRQKFSPAGVRSIIDALGPKNPELLLLEGASLVDLAQPLRAAFPHARIIFDFHNIESDLLRQLDTSRLPAVARWSAPALYGYRWRRALAADLAAGAAADAVWTCSEDDAERARTLGMSCRIEVVPNPVPAWCTPLPETPATGHPAILFVGHLGYRPNKLAVRQLAREILPQLQEQAAGATLTVAGRNPGRRMVQMLQQTGGSVLVENPADLAPLYSAANMVLLPIRLGGGTRIKVLEALAVGRPIIATALAVEGLGLVAGTHYLRAETSGEFARAALDLAADPARGAALVAAGHDHVLSSHGQAAIDMAVRTATHSLMPPDTAAANMPSHKA